MLPSSIPFSSSVSSAFLTSKSRLTNTIIHCSDNECTESYPINSSAILSSVNSADFERSITIQPSPSIFFNATTVHSSMPASTFTTSDIVSSNNRQYTVEKTTFSSTNDETTNSQLNSFSTSFNVTETPIPTTNVTTQFIGSTSFTQPVLAQPTYYGAANVVSHSDFLLTLFFGFIGLLS
ncbi:unnamed protein product [Pichia kudriavzevii]